MNKGKEDGYGRNVYLEGESRIRELITSNTEIMKDADDSMQDLKAM